MPDTPDLIEYGDPSAATSRVLLIHGWGMHGQPYEPLSIAIAKRGGHAAALTLPGHGARAGVQPFTRKAAESAIRNAAAYLSDAVPSRPLRIVAESAGADFALAMAQELRVDRLALLAPGVLPRPRQLVSPRALADLWRLIVHDRLPLWGWRLESVSSNPQFIRDRRSDGLTLECAGRGYVGAVVTETIRALWRARSTTVSTAIWQGTGDKLLEPSGARLLYKLIGALDKEITFVEGGDHGLIWDRRVGQQVVSEVSQWLTEP